MASGVGKIIATVTNGPFAYVWIVDGVTQTVVTGRTKAQAYNELGALALALPGNIVSGTVSFTTNV
jgi:hypothetical protein